MAAKTVAESKMSISQHMLPGDANPFGYVHGGTIMKLVDTAAGVVAMRHARRRVATVCVDGMSFLSPVRVGDLVVVKAAVNGVGHSSMEVGARVEVEDLLTGDVRHASSAYLVMVALDDQDRPVEVPRLIAETDDERRRAADAEIRRRDRQRARQLSTERALSPGPIDSGPAAGQRDPGGPPSAPSWLTRVGGRRPIVIGHRGAAGLAPENTLAAFRKGLELGADLLECDVHLSRDDRLVVIHDHTVDRTTDGKGRVRDLSLEELKALDAGARHGEEFAGERIPTLDEVLDLTKGRAKLSIEVKQGPVFYPGIEAAVVAALERAGALDDALVISFDHRALGRIRSLTKRVPVGVLYGARPVDPVGLARAADAQALLPQWTLVTEEDIAEARRAGLPVLPWTVNDAEQMARLLRMGVDGLTSDYPDVLRSVAESP